MSNLRMQTTSSTPQNSSSDQTSRKLVQSWTLRLTGPQSRRKTVLSANRESTDMTETNPVSLQDQASKLKGFLSAQENQSEGLLMTGLVSLRIGAPKFVLANGSPFSRCKAFQALIWRLSTVAFSVSLQMTQIMARPSWLSFMMMRLLRKRWFPCFFRKRL